MPTIPEPILDYLASIDTFLTLKAETRFPPSIRNIRIEGIITDSENFSAEARIGPGRATYSQTRLFFNLYRLLPFLYQYQRKKRLKHYAVKVEPESPFGPRFSSYLRLLNNNDYKKIVSLSFLLFNAARMLYSSSFNDDLKKEEVKKEIEDLKIKNESFSFWYLIPISLDYKN